MKKTKTTLLMISIFFGLFFVFTQNAHAEVIREFFSTINVLSDSSILVNEKITYDFDGNIRRGIFRTIPLHNSKNEPIEIRVISVTDQDNNISTFTTETKDEVLTIKIGDEDKMVSGIKEYNISYQVRGSISYFEDFDEVYWNVTGNDWQIPIEKVEAKVILPNNIFPTQQSCYYGISGSKTKCVITETNTFIPGTTLNIKEGLTIAVGFPKGVVSVYTPKEEPKVFKIFRTFLPIIIPILFFLFMFRRWYKKGRDPKSTKVIIPQYDAPKDLTPLEVGCIVNEKIKNQNISAEIIYLATCGYIKIRQIDEEENNFLGLISNNDYEFTLLKEEGFLDNDFDKNILIAIFGEQGKIGGVSKLSELKNIFYKSIPDINNGVVDILLSKKYYSNLPKFGGIEYALVTLFNVVIFSLLGTLLSAMNGFGTSGEIFVFILSAIASVIIGFIFNYLMPAKFIKGVTMKEYLLGLKEYLQIAEKDRLNFHNAPEKKPEVFEKLLPYAMIFGVEKLWAKEFDGIYIEQPEWYEGNSSSFNVIAFGAEMAVFNSIATSSLSSSPESSGSGIGGSGGGGFSGGGGGGGGGGSW